MINRDVIDSSSIQQHSLQAGELRKLICSVVVYETQMVSTTKGSCKKCCAYIYRMGDSGDLFSLKLGTLYTYLVEDITKELATTAEEESLNEALNGLIDFCRARQTLIAMYVRIIST